MKESIELSLATVSLEAKLFIRLAPKQSRIELIPTVETEPINQVVTSIADADESADGTMLYVTTSNPAIGQARAGSAASGGRCGTQKLVPCVGDIPRAVGTGQKARRNKGSAILMKADDLRARLCALLTDKRSMRTRVGRQPAVYRRPAFRSWHAALAHEFFKPTAEPSSDAASGIKKLAHSHAEGLRDLQAQLAVMSASGLAAIPSPVDCNSKDEGPTTERTEGERGFTSGPRPDKGAGVVAVANQQAPAGSTQAMLPLSESASREKRPTSGLAAQDYSALPPITTVQAVVLVAGCRPICVCAQADQTISQTVAAALGSVEQPSRLTDAGAVMLPVVGRRAVRGDKTLAQAIEESGGDVSVDVLMTRAAGMDNQDMPRKLQAQVEEHAEKLTNLLQVRESESGSQAKSHRSDTSWKFTEDDDDRELFEKLFKDLDTNNSGSISRAEINAALDRFSGHEEMKEVLKSLLQSSSECPAHEQSASHPADNELEFEGFSNILKKLPRVCGERVKWARSICQWLEMVLARNLPMGDIFDGLKGLRTLTESEQHTLAKTLAAELSAVLPAMLFEKLRALPQTNISPSSEAIDLINSKFCLDGAFIGRFATLDNFYQGPEALIGTPNPKIMLGMETEHCRRENKDAKFITSNYNIETCSMLEWEFVVHPKDNFQYPHTPSDKSKWTPEQIWSERSKTGWKGSQGRDPIKLEAFFDSAGDEQLAALSEAVAERVKYARVEIKKAGLLKEEVIGLRLYTGPLFVLYNAVLRGFPESIIAILMENKYETTIFAITSAITKLSKVTAIPANRLLYRGLGGMLVPRQFWDTYDECIVKVSIGAGAGESVESALAAVNSLLRVESDRNKVFDISVEHMRLPPNCIRESLHGLLASGIRVVKAPQPSGGLVSLTLALEVSKFTFSEKLRDDFVGALAAACRGSVAIESISDKPYGFRGGVEYGLMSTTTDKATAFAYSGVSKKRGTVFEIIAGQVDVGASISFLSQYPGEEEFLMPPLSCLEVVGEQRVDHTDDGEVKFTIPPAAAARPRSGRLRAVSAHSHMPRAEAGLPLFHQILARGRGRSHVTSLSRRSAAPRHACFDCAAQSRSRTAADAAVPRPVCPCVTPVCPPSRTCRVTRWWWCRSEST